MIPADVASQLRTLLPDKTALHGELNKAPQPAARLLEVLNSLVPGQRLLAEIQTLLPNGAYRAMVGQRELTLALPFSAKPGDTLELEVVEQEGSISLAFVGKKSTGETSPPPQQSASTQLSKTGNLIGELLTEVDQQGGKAKPALLNANQPLLETPPSNAKDIVPVLKQAINASGMFYEAHQARWVKGQLPISSLLNEPQGKLSTLRPIVSETRPAPQAPDPQFAELTTDIRSRSLLSTSDSPPLKMVLEQTYQSQVPHQAAVLTKEAIGEHVEGDSTVDLSMEASKALAAPSRAPADPNKISAETSAPLSGNTAPGPQLNPPSTEQEGIPAQTLPAEEPGQIPARPASEMPAPPSNSPAAANTPSQGTNQAPIQAAENGLIPPPQEGENPIQSGPRPQAPPAQQVSADESAATAKTGDLTRPQDNGTHPEYTKPLSADNGKSIPSESSPPGQAHLVSRDSTHSGNTLPTTPLQENLPGRPTIAPELTPLVQQQLNALATQTYAWQGMIWPGQSMQWEITEDDGKPRSTPDDFPARWQTRLKLDLPQLGSIDACLRLGNTGTLELNLTTDNPQSEQLLRAASPELASALQAAGLTLNKFTANHGEPSPG